MRNLSRFILVLGLALIIGVLPAMAQEGRAAVTLITPNYPIAVESTFDVIIQVETGGLPVDGAAAYLDFDPAYFAVVNVQPGTTLPIFLQSMTDNTAGRVDFAAGQLPPAFPSGTFTLMTVTLRALAPVDAGLITLSSDFRRETMVTFGGESVLSNAVGAMIMVSKDAAPAPENLTAPSLGIDQPFEIGGIAPVEVIGLPETTPTEELILPTLVPPFSTSMDAADAWVADAGWSLSPDGGVSGAAWAATGASVLRFAHPIDLSAQTSALVSFSSRLSAGQGQVEIRTQINPQWRPIAFVAPSAEWSAVSINLADYAGQVVQLRFVSTAADGVAGTWLVDDLSVAAAVPQVIAPAETAPVGAELAPIDGG